MRAGVGGTCHERVMEPQRRAWAAARCAERTVRGAHVLVPLAGCSGMASRPHKPPARTYLPYVDCLFIKKMVYKCNSNSALRIFSDKPMRGFS